MSKLDDLYRLHRLLDGRRTPMPRAQLIGAHGSARATLGRLIADLRYKLGAPGLFEQTSDLLYHPHLGLLIGPGAPAIPASA